jgi:DNA ligase-1
MPGWQGYVSGESKPFDESERALSFRHRDALLHAATAAGRVSWHDAEHRIKSVPWTQANSASDVDRLESEWLEQGYEGVMIRDPRAPYKHGRSGKKGPLLKVKRFIDFEARIVGCFEKMHNANEAKKDAFGRTERSTAQAGLVGTGTLGGFYLEAINGPHEGQRFKVGTGFNADDRVSLWASHKAGGALSLTGQTVKIKSFLVGAKDAPRFPVFLGFRDLEVDG